jgi:CubicO group peptidase (beta-lactamase class C family)
MMLLLLLAIQDVDALVERAFPADGPGGVVLVRRKGEVLYRRARGLADLASRRPLDVETVFDLASLSKPFTALATLILEERGKLSLEDDVRIHLPELPVRASPVRLRHLLGMTSGHADYMPLFEDLTKATNEEAARRIAAAGLIFPTGTKYAYSNSDYALLGLVVARASGRSFGGFLEEAVFAPLGMTRTAVLSPGAEIRGRATGYAREGRGWKIDRLDTPGVAGDGNVFSCAEDLARWERGFESLVKPSSLARAFTSGTLASGEKTAYGFGWVVSGDTVWHDGAWAGTRTFLSRNRSTGLSVIVLSNLSGADVNGLALRLARRFDSP